MQTQKGSKLKNLIQQFSAGQLTQKVLIQYLEKLKSQSCDDHENLLLDVEEICDYCVKLKKEQRLGQTQDNFQEVNKLIFEIIDLFVKPAGYFKAQLSIAIAEQLIKDKPQDMLDINHVKSGKMMMALKKVYSDLDVADIEESVCYQMARIMADKGIKKIENAVNANTNKESNNIVPAIQSSVNVKKSSTTLNLKWIEKSMAENKDIKEGGEVIGKAVKFLDDNGYKAGAALLVRNSEIAIGKAYGLSLIANELHENKHYFTEFLVKWKLPIGFLKKYLSPAGQMVYNGLQNKQLDSFDEKSRIYKKI